MKTAIDWFEVPATDFERARRFYETVLGTSLQTDTSSTRPGAVPMAFFPNGAAPSGALVRDPRFKPGADGPVIYLNTDGTLDDCMRRVEAAGGEVVVPVTAIGEHGRFALIRDTEGNRLGLHEATPAATRR
jgi:predicted enzyme related to lactoylglutathione lyase